MENAVSTGAGAPSAVCLLPTGARSITRLSEATGMDVTSGTPVVREDRAASASPRTEHRQGRLAQPKLFGNAMHADTWGQIVAEASEISQRGERFHHTKIERQP